MSLGYDDDINDNVKIHRARVIAITFVLLIACSTIFLVACAKTEGVNDYSSATRGTLDTGAKIEHLVGDGWSSYTVDYVENSAKTYGCFIYDGTDSGDIFCFKLGE